MKRAVIIAPSWVGDAVMALPAVADFRRRWPDAQVGVNARPSLRSLFSLISGLTVTELDATWEVALLLPNSFHAAWTAFRAGIAERWGYHSEWRGPLLTRAVSRSGGDMHQVAFYQQLVRELGCPTGSAEPHIEVTPTLLALGAQSLERFAGEHAGPLVAVAPGAAYGGAKRWPPELFAGVIEELAREGVRSVLVGSRADAVTGATIEALLAGRVPIINLIGETDLAALAGVLACCRALISNDSGGMHLGAALGVPVVAMFGPTNEHATAPLAHATILTHSVWCRPCMLRECSLDHRCMRGIGVEQVLTATREHL